MRKVELSYKKVHIAKIIWSQNKYHILWLLCIFKYLFNALNDAH